MRAVARAVICTAGTASKRHVRCMTQRRLSLNEAGERGA